MALDADLPHKGLNAHRPVVNQSARDARHPASSHSPRWRRRVRLTHSGASVEPIALQRGLMREGRRRRRRRRLDRDPLSWLQRSRQLHRPRRHRRQPLLALVAIDPPAQFRGHVPALPAEVAHRAARR